MKPAIFVSRVFTRMDKSKLSFNDYDCIGFDLDNALAKYKLTNLIELEYNTMANYLVNRKNYPGDILQKPVDSNFILKGLIIDDELGNVVKIGDNGTITHAAHGTRWLKECEILTYYPTRHTKFIDNFVTDPIEACNRPYSEKMRFSLDYFDIANSLVYARAVDTVEKHGHNGKVKDIWRDVTDSLYYMFSSENLHQNLGGYYSELKRNPKKYYRKCSQTLLNWLGNLKSSGKRLFLVTGAYAGSAHITAINTIGENWREYFDIIIVAAEKPGFFTNNSNFLDTEGFKETKEVTEDQLKLGGIYSRGNWRTVKTFLSKLSTNPDPKFLYIGDNLIHDIYTPNVFNQIDTLFISDELEAENLFGFNENHPDKKYLKSTLWGSFFYNNNNNLSYWGHIMLNYSRFFVPSVEYLAKFPIDHLFVQNN